MARLLLLPVVFALSAGCGGGSGGDMKPLDMGGEDGIKIATLVDDLNEAKGDAKKTGKLFASGAAPAAADAKKIAAHSYYIATGTKPTVTGSEGTAKVSIHSDKESKEVGQKDWNFVKEGDAWKIKAAPLP